MAKGKKHGHVIMRTRVKEPVGVRDKVRRYYVGKEPPTAKGERHFYGSRSTVCEKHEGPRGQTEGCGKLAPLVIERTIEVMAEAVFGKRDNAARE